MPKRTRVILGLVVIVAAAAAIDQLGCLAAKRLAVDAMSPEYAPSVSPEEGFVARFDGEDAERARIAVALVPVASGFVQPTDIQFVPGDPSLMIVLEKSGAARWYDLESRERGTLFEMNVLDASEQGLLGLAFHPRFAEEGRFFVNAVVKTTDQVTEVSEWRVPAGADLRRAKPDKARVVLTLAQPYPNHNAGQLQFGPDGKIYVGFGDGGWADDPHRHGQNGQTWLGAMLRLDVDAKDAPYRVPEDNPFVADPAVRPEIFALGLRNPWRYSFDPKGRLVVADVGQDTWEEIDILGPGDNAGWNLREGRHCFPPGEEACTRAGLVDPVYEYGRDDGGSVTGGYVSTAEDRPSLLGKYVFADFLSGRVWALDLPDAVPGAAAVHALGRWPFLPSTFGRDARGHLYVGGFRSGTIFRLDEAP